MYAQLKRPNTVLYFSLTWSDYKFRYVATVIDYKKVKYIQENRKFILKYMSASAVQTCKCLSLVDQTEHLPLKTTVHQISYKCINKIIFNVYVLEQCHLTGSKSNFAMHG